MARGQLKKPQSDSDAKPGAHGATTGYEAELWRMADTLRGSMDAAEYKHVALGLIFLKYISDAFEERHALLEGEREQGADPEDPDEYRAENIFWVPPEARWTHLKAQAKQPTIGQLVDDAMAGIERDNPALKDVLPKDYARAALDKQRLGSGHPQKSYYKGSIARFVRRITRGERGSAVDISATSSPPRSWREYPLKHPGSAPNERATQPPLALRALRADGP